MIAFLLGCGVAEQATLEVVTRNPLGTIDRDVDRAPVQVEIVERLDAGGYVYLRSDETPARWIVSMDKPIAVGDTVEVRPIGRADAFTSARLGRTFDALWFAVVEPVR